MNPATAALTYCLKSLEQAFQQKRIVQAFFYFLAALAAGSGLLWGLMAFISARIDSDFWSFFALGIGLGLYLALFFMGYTWLSIRTMENSPALRPQFSGQPHRKMSFLAIVAYTLALPWLPGSVQTQSQSAGAAQPTDSLSSAQAASILPVMMSLTGLPLAEARKRLPAKAGVPTSSTNQSEATLNLANRIANLTAILFCAFGALAGALLTAWLIGGTAAPPDLRQAAAAWGLALFLALSVPFLSAAAIISGFYRADLFLLLTAGSGVNF